MREIAAMRRRFGYRRVGVMLERKGHVMNHKKLYRLYRCQRAPNFPQMWAVKIPYAGGLNDAVISRIRDRVFLSSAGGRDALAVD